MEFILTNLPTILCAVIGIILLVVESCIPGFGIAGLSGSILSIIALVLTWVNHGVVPAIILLLTLLVIFGISVSLSLRSIAKGRLNNSRLVLKDTESAEDSYRSAVSLEAFCGRKGVSRSVLRPAGIAEFDGVRLDVVSEGEFIPSGETVQIIKVEGSKLLVRRVEA